MEAFDLIKAFDEVLNTTDPPKEAGPQKHDRGAGAHVAGVNLAALAAGRAGLAQNKANALAEKIAELYKKWVPNLPL